ncbi:MAG: STAS domain-containing protein [Micromonosporaceae bacterium]|nr:STAS domain-containing protein [Micromonosporaceae bacterium]
MTQPLTYRLDHRFPIAVVRLRGELTPSAGAAVRKAVLEALVEEPTSVIVDLSGLTSADGVAAQVFAAAAGQAANWPGARLLLCGPSAAVAAALRRTDVVRDLPIHPTFEAALGEAAALPLPQRLRQRLEPTIHAPRAARELAAEACASWHLAGSVIPAEIVASELVTNAVRHAGTRIDLRITLWDQQLRLSVQDRTAAPARLQSPGESDDHGRGLLIVDSVATSWGNLLLPDGKVVWASLWAARHPHRDLVGPGSRR